MQKFENMDVIAALEAIMHQNTAYYQSDFAYDIKMLREAAPSLLSGSLESDVCCAQGSTSFPPSSV